MRSRVVSGVLTAALVVSLVPAPALADAVEGAGQQLEEQVAQVAADESEAPAEEAPAEEPGEKNDAVVVEEQDPATDSAADEAEPDAETSDPLAEAEVVEDVSPDGTEAVAVPTAAPLAVNALDAQPAPQAEAPAHDAETLARASGTVSYSFEGGSRNSTSIISPNNIERIGSPMPDNETGGWRMVVTLKSDLTAADLGLSSWQVGGNDPKNVHLDSSSDRSILFSTDSPEDTTWSAVGEARAFLTFTAKASMPEKPANIAISTITDAAGAISYKIIKQDGEEYVGSASVGTDANMANLPDSYWDGSCWAVDIPLKVFETPEQYGLVLPEGFDGDYVLNADESNATVKFIYANDEWALAENGAATLVFQEAAQVPAAPTKQEVAAIQGALGYKILNADGSEAYSARVNVPEDAIESIGEVYERDGGYYVDVTVAAKDAPADYGIEPPAFYGSDYALNTDASDLTMTLGYADGAWGYAWPDVVSLTFYKPTPTVAFDINDVIGLKNAVHYYAGGSMKHATAITSIDNVVSVGDPVYHVGARKNYWTVEVTLKIDGITAADYGVPTGVLGQTDPTEWVLDETADNKATTSFTLYEGSNSWDETVSGYALLHFVHEQAPEFVLADVVDDRNTVNYSLRRAAGGQYDARSSIVSADNVESVGEPYRNDGGDWAVDVTLRSDLTADDLGIEEWQTQGNPYELDAAASKLTVTFVWTTNVLGNSSWQSNGVTNNGNLVFVEKQAPEFVLADELRTWGTLTYDLIHSDGAASRDNGAAILSADNVAEVGDAYLDADGNWAVDVTLNSDVVPTDFGAQNWQLHDDEYVLDANASKLTMTFRTMGIDGTTWYCSGADRADLSFVGKVAPAAPEFSLEDELNVVGTVSYEVRNADGSTYDDGGFGAILSADNVEKVGAVRQEADGTWAVDVTLRPDLTPADLGVDDWKLGNGSYELDPSSDLTLTFRTLSADGTAWYVLGDENRASVIFVEQAGESPDDNPGGEVTDPSDPDDEKPNDDQTDIEQPGDEQPGGDQANDGQAGGDQAKDDSGQASNGDAKPSDKAKASRTSDSAVPETGDSASVAFAGVALAGAASIAAGVAVERRRSARR